MKTYSLLIWEVIPEDTVMYLIPNEEADKIRHHLDQAHRQIINVSDMNEGLEFLNIETCSQVADANPSLPKRAGLLVQYKHDYSKAALPDVAVTYVYHSGFYL